MYKSKLQVLCQQRSWPLPEYNTAKQGLDHNPRFSATVTVNGQQFSSPNLFRASKEAQNDVAKLAFDHFSLLNNPNSQPKLPIPKPSSFPQPSLPSSGSWNATTESNITHIVKQTLQQNVAEKQMTPPINDPISVGEPEVNRGRSNVVEGNDFTATRHLHKNQLQIYTQKKNLELPLYSCEWEGPPHNRRFIGRVTVSGQTYESSGFFPTLKEAENAAAKLALMSLSPDGIQDHDISVYKNLLQELVQKEGFSLPAYETEKSGQVHAPIFISNVEIGGELFKGEVGNSKKQAEMNAAKIAYDTLKARKLRQMHLNPLSCEQDEKVSEAVVLNPITSALEQAKDGKGDLKGATFASLPDGPHAFSSSPSSSNSLNNLVMNSDLKRPAGRTLSCNKVTVIPSMENIEVPFGSTISMSDDKWIAFSHPKEV